MVRGRTCACGASNWEGVDGDAHVGSKPEAGHKVAGLPVGVAERHRCAIRLVAAARRAAAMVIETTCRREWPLAVGTAVFILSGVDEEMLRVIVLGPRVVGAHRARNRQGGAVHRAPLGKGALRPVLVVHPLGKGALRPVLVVHPLGKGALRPVLVVHPLGHEHHVATGALDVGCGGVRGSFGPGRERDAAFGAPRRRQIRPRHCRWSWCWRRCLGRDARTQSCCVACCNGRWLAG